MKCSQQSVTQQLDFRQRKKKVKSLTGRRQTVQATLDAAHRDDVQVLGPAVVAAVHDRGHGQTEGHAVLVALGTGAPCVTSGMK